MEGGGIYLLHTNNADYTYLDNSQYAMRQGLFEIIPPVKTDIIFLGDSITQRCEWHELFPNYNIQNRGIGSDISEGVLNRLDVIYESDPDAIFLMIGINDISKGVAIEEYVTNVIAIANNISINLPGCKLYIQSIPPAKSISLSKIDEYNTYLRDISRKLNCEYINIYPLFIDENGEINIEYVGNDGVHLNGLGYKIWADTLKTYLR